MNYHLLEYPELKQEAKARRIKFYYVMKKAELIKLLVMPVLPEKYIIEKKTIQTLRAEAKVKGIPGIFKMNRAALANLLYPTSSQQDDKNNNCTTKHDDPKKHNTK
jgi:hypothetical protein